MLPDSYQGHDGQRSPLPDHQNHQNLSHCQNMNHILAQIQNVMALTMQVGAKAGIRECLQVEQKAEHGLGEPCCC